MYTKLFFLKFIKTSFFIKELANYFKTKQLKMVNAHE